MTDMGGKPYTIETFNRYQADRQKDPLDWSSPVNFNYLRYECLKQFRTLVIKLAGLMLEAHNSQSVGFINAKLDNEMARLAKLIGQVEKAKTFESKMQKRIGGSKKLRDATSCEGLIAIFNQLMKDLPPEKAWPWKNNADHAKL